MFFLVMGCSAVLSLAQVRSSDVRRETPQPGSVFRDDVVYTLKDGDLQVELGFRRSDERLRFQLLRNGKAEASANIAAARKMDYLRPLLKRFFEEQGSGARYNFSMNFYTEIGARIADAAARSRDWNLRTGKSVRAGDDFTLRILKQSSFPYKELASTLESFQYKVAVDSIENRIVLPYENLTSYEKALMTTTPNPRDKLPCGASVYFVFIKEN